MLVRDLRHSRVRVRPQSTAARALPRSGQPGGGSPRGPGDWARARVALVREQPHRARRAYTVPVAACAHLARARATQEALSARVDVRSRALGARRVPGAPPHAWLGSEPRRPLAG